MINLKRIWWKTIIREAKREDPNYGSWMLVTRKKNLVRNGRMRTPIKSNGGKQVSPKGNSVHSGTRWGDIDEDTSHVSLKEDSPVTKAA